MELIEINPDKGKIIINHKYSVSIILDFKEATTLKRRIKNWNKNPFRWLKKFITIYENDDLNKEDRIKLLEILTIL